MNALLFSLPGTPVIYYGDEIGMGDNIYLGDRNGVRTPMQWNVDRNAGFSRANPQRLYLPVIIDPEYHYETVNVESQQNNSHSLLWWMKRIIALRKQYQALSRGTISFLSPDNRRVLAFLRRYENESVLVVANLSRFVQPVELDLSEFKGMAPREMFGCNQFPKIGESPYFITIAPHSFYWFSLEQARAVESLGVRTGEEKLPEIGVASWARVFDPENRNAIERLLPFFLNNSRWFRSKARVIRAVEINDVIPFPPTRAHILMVNVSYSEGDGETYVVPLSVAVGTEAEEVVKAHVNAVIARLRSAETGEIGVLYNSAWDRSFCEGMLDLIKRRRRLKGEFGEIVASHAKALGQVLGSDSSRLEPSIQKSEQSNTSIIYGDKAILKMFRLLEEGLNPDLEIGRFLSERTSFRNSPPIAGALEYRRAGGTAATLAVLHGFVPNQGDAWTLTLDNLSRYFEQVLARNSGKREIQGSGTNVFEMEDTSLRELAPGDFETARMLGELTAELHLALSQNSQDPAFAPEPFSDFYRQGLYHGMLGLARRSLLLLRQAIDRLPQEIRKDAEDILSREDAVRTHYRTIRDRRITAARIRYHGDYHLGQVLYTGRDFVIIDFEGEPARPLSERRLKRSPLRDVAGMIRSYHYAASAVLFGQVPGIIPPEFRTLLDFWGKLWYLSVSQAFLQGYLKRAGNAFFLPQSKEEFDLLLRAFLLDKAFYELSYELNNRPTWVGIPLKGIRDLLD